MLQFLHKYAATGFYLLVGSLLIAYLLLKNDVFGIYPRIWLEIADLPTIVVTLLFGGLSLYRSVAPNDCRPRLLPWVIGVPLCLLFVFLVILNFWDILDWHIGIWALSQT